MILPCLLILLFLERVETQRLTFYTYAYEVIRNKERLPDAVCGRFSNLCLCEQGTTCNGCIFAWFLNSRNGIFSRRTWGLNQFSTYEQKWDPPYTKRDNLNSQNIPNAYVHFGICRGEDNPTDTIDTFFQMNTQIPLTIVCKDCKGIYAGNILVMDISFTQVDAQPYVNILIEIWKVTFIRQVTESDRLCCPGSVQFNNIDGCGFCTYQFVVRANGKSVYLASTHLYSIFAEQETGIRLFIRENEGVDKTMDIEINPTEVKRREIDRFKVQGYSGMPFRRTFFDMTGEFTNMRLNFSIQPLGSQRAGSNFFTSCQYETTETACDGDGNAFCTNPIKNGPPFCTNDISPCSPNSPCLNGGICNGTKSFYRCNCPEGFIGKNCDKEVSLVDCNNRVRTGLQTCGDCLKGWEGRNCNIRSCEGYTKCVSGACNIISNEIRCVCDKRWSSGHYCQFICNPRCVNGLCKQRSGISFCECDFGWFGERCDVSTVPIPSGTLVFERDDKYYIALGLIVAIGSIVIVIVSVLILKISPKKVKFFDFTDDE